LTWASNGRDISLFNLLKSNVPTFRDFEMAQSENSRVTFFVSPRIFCQFSLNKCFVVHYSPVS
jgi:hypothetical protein